MGQAERGRQRRHREDEPPDGRAGADSGTRNGRAAREASGVRGGGPQAVVTNLGFLEPDENGELVLTAVHPGVTVEEVQANTGWPLKAAANLRVTRPPSEEELRLLRELDPQNIYLK